MSSKGFQSGADILWGLPLLQLNLCTPVKSPTVPPYSEGLLAQESHDPAWVLDQAAILPAASMWLQEPQLYQSSWATMGTAPALLGPHYGARKALSLPGHSWYIPARWALPARDEQAQRVSEPSNSSGMAPTQLELHFHRRLRG